MRARLTILVGLALAHLQWARVVADDGIAALVFGGFIALGFVGGAAFFGARPLLGTSEAVGLGLLLGFVWWFAMASAPSAMEAYGAPLPVGTAVIGVAVAGLAAALTIPAERLRRRTGSASSSG